MKEDRFKYVFWFVVGICSFGAGLTIFLVIYLPAEASQRVADTALIFWLSTAVSGGIGYLIGNSAKTEKKAGAEPGTTTAHMNLEVTTEPKTEEE